MTTNRNFLGAWVALLLLASTVAAMMALFARFRVEQANRAVEIVLDWAQVEELALARGESPSETLIAFGRPLAVAVPEATLADWGLRLDSGVFDLPPDRYEQAKAVLSFKTAVHETRPDQLSTWISSGDQQFWVIGESVGSIGVGLDPRAVSEVKKAGCRLVARIENFAGATESSISEALALVKAQGAYLVIFGRDEVLGSPDALEATAEALAKHGLLYGTVEFGKQAGDANLAKMAFDQTVRVHSVTSGELVYMRSPALIERYSRAAQERNIRALLTRFPMGGMKQPDAPMEFVRQLTSALSQNGMDGSGKPARPYEKLPQQPWSKPLIALGIGAAGGLLLVRLFGLPAWLLIVVPLVSGGLAMHPMGIKLLALGGAIAFPTVGFLTVRPDRSRWLVSDAASVIACALLGAIHVAALMNGDRIFIKADQFAGIKIALMAPVLLVGLAYAPIATGEANPWRRLLDSPIVWRTAIVLLGMMVVVGVMTLRAGNEAADAVPGWELQLRSLLEKALSVRPRTKEFLIGIPALFVMLSLWRSGRANWLPLWGMLAAIGMASMVNTFCHLHTPLWVSAARTGWGIAIGSALGLIAVAILARYRPKASS
ncbi:MAG: hypothetical protein HUU60_06720 [Armatimonadetes bacterium]|nr:hypothetical protein [Armatimonadota bacterium]